VFDLCNSATFLIRDGPCSDRPVSCSMLWVSSPRPGSYQKVIELALSKQYFLSLWTADELVECYRAGCLPMVQVGMDEGDKAARIVGNDAVEALDAGADEAAMDEARLRRWAAEYGPVARRVLNPAVAATKLSGALDALSKEDIDTICSIASNGGGDNDKFKHSHRVLLMVASGDYSAFSFVPASVKVGQRLLQRKFEKEMDSARSMMGKLSGGTQRFVL
jgi:hypothetical protein